MLPSGAVPEPAVARVVSAAALAVARAAVAKAGPAGRAPRGAAERRDLSVRLREPSVPRAAARGGRAEHAPAAQRGGAEPGEPRGARPERQERQAPAAAEHAREPAGERHAPAAAERAAPPSRATAAPAERATDRAGAAERTKPGRAAPAETAGERPGHAATSPAERAAERPNGAAGKATPAERPNAAGRAAPPERAAEHPNAAGAATPAARSGTPARAATTPAERAAEHPNAAGRAGTNPGERVNEHSAAPAATGTAAERNAERPGTPGRAGTPGERNAEHPGAPGTPPGTAAGREGVPGRAGNSGERNAGRPGGPGTVPGAAAGREGGPGQPGRANDPSSQGGGFRNGDNARGNDGRGNDNRGGDRGERRGGISPGGAAAIGAAAGFAGGFLAATGARDLDGIRRDRREEVEDGRTYIREPGRTIVDEGGGRAFIVHDENDRFRDLGYDVHRERRGDDYVDRIDRPDGVQILTFTTRDGRMLRRVRRYRDGREVVLIDNAYDGGIRPYDQDVVDLPPPRYDIPRDRYIVDYNGADESSIYDTLIAPPVARPPRRYTLDQIRYSPDIRRYVRSVDINTINFASGSWIVPASATGKLQALGTAIKRAVAQNPNSVFLVEGYTDATGNPNDNLSLSDHRAQSVAAILSKDFGVPPENLTTQGYGQQNLKVNTSGPSVENRRVVVQNITQLMADNGGNAPPPR